MIFMQWLLRDKGGMSSVKYLIALADGFHARATVRYRRNVISQISDSTGRLVSDHGEKSGLFLSRI